MIKTFKIENIEWDTDGEDVDLPDMCWVELGVEPDESDESISDRLTDIVSDHFGWCHYGFNYRECEN